MMGVQTLVAYLPMGFRQSNGDPFPSMAAPLASVLDLGQHVDALESFAQVTRVFNRLTSGQRSKAHDRNVSRRKPCRLQRKW